MDEVLAGGVANSGAVRRRGDVVIRPSNAHSPTIHAFLRALCTVGFTGAPEPIGLSDSEEELRFVEGDVALPPYPAWAQSHDSLASVAKLLRRFHDTSAQVSAPLLGDAWSDAFGAPSPEATVICHLDVCLENVVFRDGAAVALLDFDFAAPGTRMWDVACLTRMCVPIDCPEDAGRMRRTVGDPFRRLRLVADAYGLSADRTELVDLLGMQTSAGGWFVKRRVDAGDAAFTRMWDETGGAERYDRRRDWFEANRQHFLDALQA